MYTEENDYEINYLISENNEAAKEVVYKKYKPIIEMKASKFKNYVESRGYDYNDLIQEGMMGLSKAIKDFSEKKNTQFSSFANLCIDRHISSFIRNIDRDKHKLLNNSISIDTTYNSIGKPLIEILLDNKNVDPEETFIKFEDQTELYSQIKESLTDSENEVFDLRIQGFSYKEIADILGITEKSVGGSITRIRNKVNNIIKKRGE